MKYSKNANKCPRYQDQYGAKILCKIVAATSDKTAMAVGKYSII